MPCTVIRIHKLKKTLEVDPVMVKMEKSMLHLFCCKKIKMLYKNKNKKME